MEEYFGIISNTAGGYSFYRDARLRRLTRYRYNNAPLDVGGDIFISAITIPIARNSGRQPGSPPEASWISMNAVTAWAIPQSVHNKSGLIAAQLVILCRWAESGNMENSSDQSAHTERRLSIFSAIEFCLWDAQDDANNFQRNYSHR